MRESGRTIKLMALGDISTLMGPSMKGIGRKTNSMDMARKHGLMVRVTREIIKTARRMERASSCGLMARPMRDNL
jgi:hypothetical protein